MNCNALKNLCCPCIFDLGLDPEEFGFQWELLESRGLVGQTSSFGSREQAQARQVLGFDADPQTEALAIGVLAALIANGIESGAKKLARRMADPKHQPALLDSLGDMGGVARLEATRVYRWAHAHIPLLIAACRVPGPPADNERKSTKCIRRRSMVIHSLKLSRAVGQSVLHRLARPWWRFG